MTVSFCNGILFWAIGELLSYGKCQEDIKTVQDFTKQINSLCWIISVTHLRACRGGAEGKNWRGECQIPVQCLTSSWFRILPHMVPYFIVYLYISLLLALCFYYHLLLLFEMYVTFRIRGGCLVTQKLASFLISSKILQVSVNIFKLLFSKAYEE